MFEAGALVLLPFPFSDATTAKRRPVLALTKPDEYGDFIGMAVSSCAHHANAVPLQGGCKSRPTTRFAAIDGRIICPS